MYQTIILLGILLLAGFAAISSSLMVESESKARKKRLENNPNCVSYSPHLKEILEN